MAYRWRSALRVDALGRELRGVALALAMVVATAVVGWALIRYLDVRRGSVIFLLPVLLAGWIAQKQLVRGLTMGAVK